MGESYLKVGVIRIFPHPETSACVLPIVLKGWHCSDSPVFYFKLALVIIHQQRTPSGNVSTLFLGSIPSETNSDFVFSPSSLPPIIATCTILSSASQVKKAKCRHLGERNICVQLLMPVSHSCFMPCLVSPDSRYISQKGSPWQISFGCWSVPPDFLQSNQKKMMWWNYSTSIPHSYYSITHSARGLQNCNFKTDISYGTMCFK